jgi:hypothetical protein
VEDSRPLKSGWFFIYINISSSCVKTATSLKVHHLFLVTVLRPTGMLKNEEMVIHRVTAASDPLRVTLENYFLKSTLWDYSSG